MGCAAAALVEKKNPSSSVTETVSALRCSLQQTAGRIRSDRIALLLRHGLAWTDRSVVAA